MGQHGRPEPRRKGGFYRASTPDVDVLVVGAGAVGLACAAAAARRGRSVVLVERHGGPGRETSSRNSGVVHAGLYYPPGSLKAVLCVEGRERLYRWCEARKVPHRRTGKLVVATTPAETPRLQELAEQGRANGAGELALLEAREVRRRDPALEAVAALWSPESGLVDAHALVASLLADARAHGAEVAWGSAVREISSRPGHVRVTAATADGEAYSVRAGTVVNAAGLSADRIAALAGVNVAARGWRQHPCQGRYFALAPDAPRPRTALVYPVPATAGLGVHLTTDLGGRCIAGPDARYVQEVDYAVDPAAATPFAEAVARYLPGVRPEHLTPDYAGVRPKLQGPGEGFRDFVLAEEPGRVVHLLGIESPGLTAALALGERVADRVAEQTG